MSIMPSLGQYPVGGLVVHATADSMRMVSISPSDNVTLMVRLCVAMTTHSEEHSVTQIAFLKLKGMVLSSLPPVRATSGATSSFEETATMGAAHGICVRNGLSALAQEAFPSSSTMLSFARSGTSQPFRER